jgi:hypothetical protein
MSVRIFLDENKEIDSEEVVEKDLENSGRKLMNKNLTRKLDGD